VISASKKFIAYSGVYILVKTGYGKGSADAETAKNNNPMKQETKTINLSLII
jgi:hypothetical protein